MSEVQVMTLDEQNICTQYALGWLNVTVRSLVDRPNAVFLAVEMSEGVVQFKLWVDPDDIGKVIGKQGRMARSLRTILLGLSHKSQLRYQLDIVERPNSIGVEA